MPICQNYATNYDDALAACPQCGQANPGAQAAAVVCPNCQSSEKVYKIGERENDLPEELAFPDKPAAPEINTPLAMLGVALTLGSLFGLIRGHSPLIFALCMLVAIVCFLRARVTGKQAEAYIAKVKNWRAAKAQWDALYYCADCKQVFLPGEKAASPAERRDEYLNQQAPG
jgi:hypothetical protein